MKLTWMKLAIPALLGVILLPLAAQARPINERQDHQQDRIREGERSGELTRQEAARLEQQEARIRQQEYEARRSGNGLSDAERDRLQRELDRQSDAIHHQKHDDQRYNGHSYNGYNSYNGYGSNGYYVPRPYSGYQPYNTYPYYNGYQTYNQYRPYTGYQSYNQYRPNSGYQNYNSNNQHRPGCR